MRQGGPRRGGGRVEVVFGRSVDREGRAGSALLHPADVQGGREDGYSAARIEEEVVVTDKGCRVITLFPAEELPIANRY
jgi:hypothetical protein